MSKVVNQRELAEVFGVSHQTMANWQREGMPVLKQGENGQENQYATAAVIEWYAARTVQKTGVETQRDRLTRLQGDDLELKLSQQRGELVPAEQIEPVWHSRCLAAAAYLLGQHSRLASILESTPGVEAKREIIKTTFAEFLTKLGHDGAAMQDRVEALLAQLSTERADEFMRTLTGPAAPPAEPSTENDDPSNASANSQVGVDPARPAGTDPAVGMG